MLALGLLTHVCSLPCVCLRQGLDWDNAISAANAAFTGIFLIEMLLK
jgi:hypothetical protein